MALIGKIRQRTGLLLGMMVVAIAGFIFMDVYSSGQMGGGFGNHTNLGTVEGQKLDVKEFDNTIKTLYNNAPDPTSIRTQLWSKFVDASILKKIAGVAGFGVSKDEMMDLEFGNNVSPVIAQNQQFSDPSTGQVNRQMLNQIKQAIASNTLPPDGRLYWAEMEKDVYSDKLQEKIGNIIMKGIYTPTWMADMILTEANSVADFDYVKVPFDAVAENAIKVTDDDYATYLKDNSAKYTQDEASRKVDFVIFNIVATSTDSANTRAAITANIEEFKTVTNDSNFVSAKGGYITDFAKKDKISKLIADKLASSPVGTVIGAYDENNACYAAKLIDRKNVADSAKARHILLKGGQTSTPDGLKRKADSLVTLLETGRAAWDSLNTKYNDDKAAAAKGGDLGTFAPGAMVKEFNDLVFYKATPGKYYTVNTQFGVHIVQVGGFKILKNDASLKIAYIREPYIPSDVTEKSIADKANLFLTSSRNLDDLRKNAKTQNLEVTTSPGFKENDNTVGILGQGANSRELVRWAYKTSNVGEVSPQSFTFTDQQENYTNKYVIAGLRSIQEKGLPTLANIKDEIMPMVKNMKKAEVIKTKITGKTLEDVVTAYTSKIDTARNVTLANGFIPNAGNEPKVVAIAHNTAINAISKPIIGETGVYIVKVLNKKTINQPITKEVLKQNLAGQARQQIKSGLFASLRKNAKIDDNRSAFF
jgi:peptidyl-prolyl cis-trans isomerase D